jgi:hypothetical protein
MAAPMLAARSSIQPRTAPRATSKISVATYRTNRM